MNPLSRYCVTLPLSMALRRLATEHGFSLFLAEGTILDGWALAELDQGQEGIAQMRHGLAAYQATGAEMGRPDEVMECERWRVLGWKAK